MIFLQIKDKVSETQILSHVKFACADEKKL